MLSAEKENISASMATFRSLKTGALGSSVMGSFFDEYMLSVVAHGRLKLHRE